MSNHPSRHRNYILAALPSGVQARLVPHLEAVTLTLGEVSYEPGDIVTHAYFPTDSIVSLLYVMEPKTSGEISIVGNDGLTGTSLYMGGNSTPTREVVHRAGSAYRLSGPILTTEFNRHSEFLQVLLRYTQSLMTQVSQTAVCNRHHTVRQQLCRLPLFCLDRLSGNELKMTQGLIASMLGVRREGVPVAAVKLQSLGLIECRRGRITVLDRPGLEAQSCECYAVVKAEADRLLPERNYE